VYVVDPDKKAHIRVITLKTTQANDVSVGPELKPGELVVVEGTDKVQEGARVDLQTPGAPAAPAGQNGGSGPKGSDGSAGGGTAGGGRGGRGKRSGQ
jgi:multidrug efflux system membrane fusion protein